VKRNAIIIAVVTVTIAIILFGAQKLAREGREQQIVAGTGAGGLAPDFELKTLEGKAVRLSELRGKAVVVNFWATWCAPCKLEMPWLVELQKQYGEKELAVIGIAMDEDTDSIAAMMKELGVNYTVLLGTESVGDAYGGVQFLPATFYIDRAGKITSSKYGFASRREMEDSIKKALAGGAAQTAGVQQ
jgi:thiol-disulfide isomerase/thioredoxin